MQNRRAAQGNQSWLSTPSRLRPPAKAQRSASKLLPEPQAHVSISFQFLEDKPMSIDRNDVHRILKLVDETERFAEVEVELDGWRLHIRRHSEPGQPEPANAPAPMAGQAVDDHPRISPRSSSESISTPPKSASSSDPAVGGNVHVIKAPLLGTFYRSPAPGEKPFVEVGQRVTAEDTVCIIEVMKLFNSIGAGVNGVIKEIRAADSELVEYGQTLFLIQAD